MRLLQEIVSAQCHGAEKHVQVGLNALEDYPPTTLDRQIRSLLDASVTAAWDHGWQPTEIVYQLRRKGSERATPLLLDAIAAQMRQYSATTVDPRWSRQLTALDATVWWQDDETWLPTVATRLGRREMLRSAIEIVAMLCTLDPVQELCPPPGKGSNVPREGAAAPQSDGNERMLRKIRALLAKAESTDFPEEAETLSAQAQQLMMKYSIDAALLAAQTSRPAGPSARRIPVENPYESPKVTLLSVVATASRCRAVWSRRIGMVTVIGFPAELDAVELMFTSLSVQATSAMTRAGSRTDRSGRSTTRSFRQSFLVAYASRIGERLHEASDAATTAAVASAGGSLLPVLASREAAVESAVGEMFTNLRHTTGSSVTNPEGWHAGRAAADVASLQHRSSLAH